MADSIFDSVKTTLGIAEDDESFDLEVLTHINSVFSTLEQLGVGPVGGFMIDDSSAEWGDFLQGDHRLNQVKTYMYLRVRLLFDPPTTSFHLESLKEQRLEMEWRLNVVREGDLP